MTTGPPWVLACPVVTVTRPQPAAIGVTLRPRAVAVPWPRLQVTRAEPPRPPRVIRLAARPQGPRRLPLSPVVRDLLALPLPARAG